jgi:hypothetical protein
MIETAYAVVIANGAAKERVENYDAFRGGTAIHDEWREEGACKRTVRVEGDADTKDCIGGEVATKDEEVTGANTRTRNLTFEAAPETEWCVEGQAPVNVQRRGLEDEGMGLGAVDVGPRGARVSK